MYEILLQNQRKMMQQKTRGENDINQKLLMTVHKSQSQHQMNQVHQRGRVEPEISQDIPTILHNHLHQVELLVHNLRLLELTVSQRKFRIMTNPRQMMYRLRKIWHLHRMDSVVTFASRCSEIMMN